MQDVGITVRFEPLLAPLAPEPTLLVPAEKRLRRRLLERVDEDGPRLQPFPDALGARDVPAPYAGAEARVGAVRALDDFFFVGPGLGGDDGAEGLLGDDAGVVGRVVDDGWLDELGSGGLD